MTQKSGAFIRTDGALPTLLRKYAANTWNSFVSFVVVNMWLNSLYCEMLLIIVFIMYVGQMLKGQRFVKAVTDG